MENKAKILIIEDDEVLQKMYGLKLTEAGYTVLATGQGQEGLELAQKEKPNVILLDIILPQIDGFTILEKLKKDPGLKNIPVILLTNLGQEEDIQKGKKLEAADYLVKANFTPGEIVKKVQKHLSS